ncbi:MAG: hypothetical protein HY305_03895, partial [Sphingobacteriales bacterium]|nr:hypothetical protein [Sphingobacteriales bacterium]
MSLTCTYRVYTSFVALSQNMLPTPFIDSFGDKRLDERGNKFVRDLLVRGSHSIRQISQSSSIQKGHYRF